MSNSFSSNSKTSLWFGQSKLDMGCLMLSQQIALTSTHHGLTSCVFPKFQLFPSLALSSAICHNNFGPLKPLASKITRDPLKGAVSLEGKKI